MFGVVRSTGVISIPWDRGKQQGAVLILRMIAEADSFGKERVGNNYSTLFGENCISVMDLVRDGKGGKKIVLQLYNGGARCGKSKLTITASGRSFSPVFKHTAAKISEGDSFAGTLRDALVRHGRDERREVCVCASLFIR